jgi:membrane protein
MSIRYILKAAILSFKNDGCLNLSAAIAFYAILSLIPFAYLLVSLVGVFLGSKGEVLKSISLYITQVIPFISEKVLREVGKINLGSGVFAWLAVFFMLWSSTLIFDSIEFALKKIFKAEHARPFWVSKIISLIFLPMAGIIFIFLQVLNIAIDTFIRLSTFFEIDIISLFINNIALKHIFPFFLSFLLLSTFYTFFIPGRILFKQAMAGGFICTAMLEIGKYVFSWFIVRNPNFGLVYGSLNTMILMILWIFYASAIFLFCAEIINAYQKTQVINGNN